MQFLETRSEVKFNVTITQKWYATLRHPNMHPHTQLPGDITALIYHKTAYCKTEWSKIRLPLKYVIPRRG